MLSIEVPESEIIEAIKKADRYDQIVRAMNAREAFPENILKVVSERFERAALFETDVLPKCGGCGKYLIDKEARFCPYCGRELIKRPKREEEKDG